MYLKICLFILGGIKIDWLIHEVRDGQRSRYLSSLKETLRFEDENDYEYEVWFKVFSSIVKK